jgi:hypothetical protein
MSFNTSKNLTQKKTEKRVTKSNRGRRAPLTEVAKLKLLARTIRDGHEATEKYIKSAKDQARDALREAILTGKALTEVKQIVGFGGFTRWLKEHCKGVNERTGQRYMSLYNAFGRNTSHVSELPEMSLRKAYLQLGIINEVTVPDRERGGRMIEEKYDARVQVAPSVKQLTDAVTTGTQSTGNESIQQSNDDRPIEAEIVSTDDKPRVVAGNTPRTTSRAEFEAIHASTLNTLLLDLFNMNKSGHFTLDELQEATIEPLKQFLSQGQKRMQTPAPKKESFFQTPANAGLLS